MKKIVVKMGLLGDFNWTNGPNNLKEMERKGNSLMMLKYVKISDKSIKLLKITHNNENSVKIIDRKGGTLRKAIKSSKSLTVATKTHPISFSGAFLEHQY